MGLSECLSDCAEEVRSERVWGVVDGWVAIDRRVQACVIESALRERPKMSGRMVKVEKE